MRSFNANRLNAAMPRIASIQEAGAGVAAKDAAGMLIEPAQLPNPMVLHPFTYPVA